MDEREMLRFRAQMRLLQRRLRREVLPVLGVSRTAMHVLLALHRLPDGSQPRQIGEELQMTSSNVAAALRELEEAGFVSRRRDEADARRVLVRLDERGRTAVSAAQGERDSWLGRAIETVLEPEEQRTLLAAGVLMQRLAEFERAPAATGAASVSDAEGAS